mgnify:FL=1
MFPKLDKLNGSTGTIIKFNNNDQIKCRSIFPLLRDDTRWFDAIWGSHEEVIEKHEQVSRNVSNAVSCRAKR